MHAQGTLFPPQETDALTTRATQISPLLPPYTAIGGPAAAWLWDIDALPPSSDQSRWPIQLIVPPDRPPPRLEGCHPLRSPLPPDDITVHSGVRLTTLERTALDCARWLPRPEAVAALDQFLRRGIPLHHLLARAATLTGRPHTSHLLNVLAAADRGAESPGESRTRVLIIDTGFPRPQTQIPLAGPGGAPAFIDLGYEQYKVGIEYDGEEHHSLPATRAHDEARRKYLRDHHAWEIIPVTKSDVFYTPRPFLEALMTELFEAGWTPDDPTLTKIMTRLTRRRPPRTPRPTP